MHTWRVTGDIFDGLFDHGHFSPHSRPTLLSGDEPVVSRGSTYPPPRHVRTKISGRSLLHSRTLPSDGSLFDFLLHTTRGTVHNTYRYGIAICSDVGGKHVASPLLHVVQRSLCGIQYVAAYGRNVVHYVIQQSLRRKLR